MAVRVIPIEILDSVGHACFIVDFGGDVIVGFGGDVSLLSRAGMPRAVWLLLQQLYVEP